MVFQEVIQMVAEVRDLATGKIKKITESTQELSDSMKKITTRTTTFTKSGKKVTETIKTMTGNFKKFRMELLSVMFGSMMVSRALFGLLNPALQAVGAFELWNTTLEMLFLPTAMNLLENFFIPLLDNVSNLHPAIQTAIGSFTLFGAGLATLLEKGAELGLFLGGLALAWPKFAPHVPLILGALGLIAKAALIGVSLYFVYESIKAFMKKDIWNGIILAFMAIGFGLLTFFPVAGAAALFIGFSLKYIKSSLDKAKKDINELADYSPYKRAPNPSESYVPNQGLYRQSSSKITVPPIMQSNYFNNTNNVNANSNVDVDIMMRQLNDTTNAQYNGMMRR